MWIHISAIANTSIFSHKTRGGKYLTNSFPTKIFHKFIVENTENSPNSSSYTIEYKSVRNSHLASQKNLAFSQRATAIVHTNKRYIAHTQNYQSSIQLLIPLL